MGRRAFTIVEVLVVVAVIAVLVGLLLPVAGSVRASGRAAACASNLRQMTLAARQYGLAYDAFPAAIRYERVGGAFQQIAWDWITTMRGDLVGPGPLWTFSDHPDRVQQCPEYLGETNFAGDPYTGYNYNTSYVGSEATFPQQGWTGIREGVRPHACSRDTVCAMFGDGGFSGGTNKFMRAPSDHEGVGLPVVYGGGQAFRHLGGTNVAFLDGHVGAITRPHEGERASRALLDDVMRFPRNGFLSDDDRAYRPN